MRVAREEVLLREGKAYNDFAFYGFKEHKRGSHRVLHQWGLQYIEPLIMGTAKTGTSSNYTKGVVRGHCSELNPKP